MGIILLCDHQGFSPLTDTACVYIWIKSVMIQIIQIPIVNTHSVWILCIFIISNLYYVLMLAMHALRPCLLRVWWKCGRVPEESGGAELAKFKF